MSLSTHVLDTVKGLPAAGVTVELLTADRAVIASARTNEDGRVSFGELAEGEYELVFFAGDYLRGQGTELPSPAFIDVVRRHLRYPQHLSP